VATQAEYAADDLAFTERLDDLARDLADDDSSEREQGGVIGAPPGLEGYHGRVYCDYDVFAMQDPEPTKVAPVKVAQPKVRQARGTLPRRGHVGGTRRPAARATARTSSRGGDSGDDGSGDPEPGPHGSGRLTQLLLNGTDPRTGPVLTAVHNPGLWMAARRKGNVPDANVSQ
jgi:hypothetical protein